MMGSQILNCPEQQDCHGSEMAQHGGSYPGEADLLLLLSFSHLVILPSTPSPPCFLPTVPPFPLVLEYLLPTSPHVSSHISMVQWTMILSTCGAPELH